MSKQVKRGTRDAYTDPMAAMAEIEAFPRNAPGLLITDVEMSHMDGIELARCIKAICPTCKLLLFSGQPSTDALLAGALAEGNNSRILAKPVQPTDLLAAIRSL